MSYVLPQVLVFQEFQDIPDEITDPLRACLIGPQADLHRYTDEAERPETRLGGYDPFIDAEFSYPHRTPGGVVDTDYTRLFVEDASLEYHNRPPSDTNRIRPVHNYRNRIRSDDGAFASNEADVHDAVFKDRGVRPSDSVRVRGTIAGEDFELNTYVQGFIPEKLPPEIGDPYADPRNSGAVAENVVIAQTAGEENNVSLSADISGYDGVEDGAVVQRYTVRVLSGSAEGDLTTAVLSLRSKDGKDNVEQFSPAADGTLRVIGRRGLQLQFDIAGGSVSGTGGDLVRGQFWTVDLAQDYTPPAVSGHTSYTGDKDTTYVVEVKKGGSLLATSPRDRPYFVTTTVHGDDYSSGTYAEHDRLYSIGRRQVRIKFEGDQLAAGEKYYIDVKASRDGRVSTIVLGHNLPEDVTTLPVDVTFSMTRDIEVNQQKVEAPPELQFESNATTLTVAPGMTAFEATWTEDGVEQALPVVSGTMFVQYREWLSESSGSIHTISDSGDLSDVAGPLDPDNPLKWALFHCLQNANGTDVKYASVSSPSSLDSWAISLDLTVGREDIYNIVPLTRRRDVHDLFVTNVNDQSSAEAGRWRATVVPLTAEPSVAVVDGGTTTDGNAVLAVITDDPDTEAEDFTIVQSTSGNIDFVTAGVRPGDIVRYAYTTDGFEGVEYAEYVVDAIVNATEIRLFSGPDTAAGVPQRLEIWHNRDKNEVAEAIAADAQSFNNPRVVAVWPDTVGAGGRTVEGFNLSAAIAGLVSGVVPHQGLTNVELSGFDDVGRSDDYFNGAQLDTLAGAGVWVVARDESGAIVTRHAVTTNTTDLTRREEVVRRNVDSISKLILKRLRRYIGRSNITPTSLSMLRVELVSAIEYLKVNGFIERLGGQLIGGEIVELRQHALLKDRVVCTIRLEVPFPMNNIEVHLVA